MYICKKLFGIDIAASSGIQGKYMKYVRFFRPPLVTALSVFNFSTLFKKYSFCGRIKYKQRRLPPMSNHKLSKNICLENIRS
jgi:hypothetical protein